MLLAITYQLREALKARKVPYPVVYGPERTVQSSMAASHIVVERDRIGKDGAVRPPKTHHRNPAAVAVRPLGAVVRVFAAATKNGASVADHERIADALVDQILCSLRVIASDRKTEWRTRSAGFLSADELAERQLTTWPGVVYELSIEIDRGVRDADYAGEAAEEATAGGDDGFSVATTLDDGDSPEAHIELPGSTTR